MRTVLTVLAAWILLSALVTIAYAWGATMGWRRGWTEGYEGARADLAQRTITLEAGRESPARERAGRQVR